MKSRCRILVFAVAALCVCGCGAAENPASAETKTVHGSLSKAVIRGVIHKQIGMIEQCTNTYCRPGESGRVTVRFIVRGDGNVTDATIFESTFDNPRLEKCILAAPQYWHFPKPEGGGIVIVTYPFELSMPQAGGGTP
jgi:TonB family protein